MTAFRTLNTAVFAPVPSVSVRTTIAANRGAPVIERTAYLRSTNAPSMCDFDGAGGEKVGKPRYAAPTDGSRRRPHTHPDRSTRRRVDGAAARAAADRRIHARRRDR